MRVSETKKNGKKYDVVKNNFSFNKTYESIILLKKWHVQKNCLGLMNDF